MLLFTGNHIVTSIIKLSKYFIKTSERTTARQIPSNDKASKYLVHVMKTDLKLVNGFLQSLQTDYFIDLQLGCIFPGKACINTQSLCLTDLPSSWNISQKVVIFNIISQLVLPRQLNHFNMKNNPILQANRDIHFHLFSNLDPWDT